MMKVYGIFLMTLANLILLAHVVVPHNHCEENPNQPHHHAHNHDHDHGHSHDHQNDSEEHSDLSHFFCSIAHTEDDFTINQHTDLQLNSLLSHAVIIYTLFKPFEGSSTDQELLYFGEEKTSIYHSPHLIRSGEKAPPIA